MPTSVRRTSTVQTDKQTQVLATVLSKGRCSADAEP